MRPWADRRPTNSDLGDGGSRSRSSDSYSSSASTRRSGTTAQTDYLHLPPHVQTDLHILVNCLPAALACQHPVEGTSAPHDCPINFIFVQDHKRRRIPVGECDVVIEDPPVPDSPGRHAAVNKYFLLRQPPEQESAQSIVVVESRAERGPVFVNPANCLDGIVGPLKEFHRRQTRMNTCSEMVQYHEP